VALRPWRSPRPPKPPKPLRQKHHPRTLNSRRLRRLLTRPPERLTDEERVVVQGLLAADAKVAAAYALVQRFRTLLKERDAAALDAWLAEAQASGIPSLAGVASGMRADYSAVVAGVTESWSNGVVEGHVHKVKLLKRQGYGRASFALLRQRVLIA
jgi:transposase